MNEVVLINVYAQSVALHTLGIPLTVTRTLHEAAGVAIKKSLTGLNSKSEVPFLV